MVQTPAAAEPQTNLSHARMRAERESLVAALQRASWSASQAARLMGVSRATFYRLLTKHELTAEESGPHTLLEEPAGEDAPPHERTH